MKCKHGPLPALVLDSLLFNPKNNTVFPFPSTPQLKASSVCHLTAFLSSDVEVTFSFVQGRWLVQKIQASCVLDYVGRASMNCALQSFELSHQLMWRLWTGCVAHPESRDGFLDGSSSPSRRAFRQGQRYWSWHSIIQRCWIPPLKSSDSAILLI